MPADAIVEADVAAAKGAWGGARVGRWKALRISALGSPARVRESLELWERVRGIVR